MLPLAPTLDWPLLWSKCLGYLSVLPIPVPSSTARACRFCWRSKIPFEKSQNDRPEIPGERHVSPRCEIKAVSDAFQQDQLVWHATSPQGMAEPN